MNKKEFSDKVAEKMGVTKKIGGQAVEAMLDVIMDTVATGEKIKIVGFGSFERKLVKGRTGTMQFGDKKGQKWATKDSFKPIFKSGKEFEGRLNE